MPSSVIIVALVVAWLLVLVPIIARRRQEVAKTADSALAARIVHSGARAKAEEECTMADKGEAGTTRAGKDDTDQHRGDHLDDLDGVDEELAEDFAEELARAEQASHDHASHGHDEPEAVDHEPEDDPVAEAETTHPDDPHDDHDDRHDDDERPTHRPYRPGRGGFDPEAAALTARARYATRQRAVVIMLILAVLTAIGAGFVLPVLWWAHGAVDVALVSYLTYLRRQVRIENEIRQRRLSRIAAARRPGALAFDDDDQDARGDDAGIDAAPAAPPVRSAASTLARTRPLPGTVVVDLDDEDPLFDDLDDSAALPYRRAVGE